MTAIFWYYPTLNAIIHRYKAMIHQQQGHHHGTGTGTPGGGGGDVIHPVNEDGGNEEDGVLD